MTKQDPVEGRQRETNQEIMIKLDPVEGRLRETSLEIMKELDPVKGTFCTLLSYQVWSLGNGATSSVARTLGLARISLREAIEQSQETEKRSRSFRLKHIKMKRPSYT